MQPAENSTGASVYCSTSGTYFTDKDELAEHYKSDFHRYNLKRKIAGLPPVTKEWFDSRKEQLSSTASLAAQKTWTDPLTRRRFGSENTYNAFVQSKKYQNLVKQSGQAQPKPYVSLQRSDPNGDENQPSSAYKGAKTHSVKAPNRGPSQLANASDETDSEWETASDESEAEAGPESEFRAGSDIASQEWDVNQSFFDNRISANMEANLEYMWKNFGFYLPDAEFLQNPEGLLKYLGAKLSEGHIPLYASGLDENAKQLASLHAVQRHMVDTNQCKMVYEGNEEEYEDFYDYSKALSQTEDGVADLTLADEVEASTSGATGGFELAIGDTNGKGGKILGSRDFARYYRQNHKPEMNRSPYLAALQQRYRNLGVALIESPGEMQAKRAVKQAQKQAKKGDRIRLRTDMQTNVNRNLPRNVTY